MDGILFKKLSGIPTNKHDNFNCTQLASLSRERSRTLTRIFAYHECLMCTHFRIFI